MTDLDEIKAAAEADLRARIAAGDEIAGQVLPPDPIHIEVRGRRADDLQARVVYRDVAPYYLRVSRGHISAPPEPKREGWIDLQMSQRPYSFAAQTLSFPRCCDDPFPALDGHRRIENGRKFERFGCVRCHTVYCELVWDVKL
jgi:hypothetical protein